MNFGILVYFWHKKGQNSQKYWQILANTTRYCSCKLLLDAGLSIFIFERGSNLVLAIGYDKFDIWYVFLAKRYLTDDTCF